jgi:hypothetical protein
MRKAKESLYEERETVVVLVVMLIQGTKVD